jgi:hypothetical protein
VYASIGSCYTNLHGHWSARCEDENKKFNIIAIDEMWDALKYALADLGSKFTMSDSEVPKQKQCLD